MELMRWIVRRSDRRRGWRGLKRGGERECIAETGRVGWMSCLCVVIARTGMRVVSVQMS